MKISVAMACTITMIIFITGALFLELQLPLITFEYIKFAISGSYSNHYNLLNVSMATKEMQTFYYTEIGAGQTCSVSCFY
jgi:hypothetical protein